MSTDCFEKGNIMANFSEVFIKQEDVENEECTGYFQEDTHNSYLEPNYDASQNSQPAILQSAEDLLNSLSAISDKLPRPPRRTRKPTQKMADSLCRICEHMSAHKLIKIFGPQGKQLKLADKIHFHLPIKVKQSDKLPLGVCVSCVNALSACDELYHTSLNTDMHLREIFVKELSTTVSSAEIDSVLSNQKAREKVKRILGELRENSQSLAVNQPVINPTSVKKSVNNTSIASMAQERRPTATNVLKLPSTNMIGIQTHSKDENKGDERNNGVNDGVAKNLEQFSNENVAYDVPIECDDRDEKCDNESNSDENSNDDSTNDNDTHDENTSDENTSDENTNDETTHDENTNNENIQTDNTSDARTCDVCFETFPRKIYYQHWRTHSKKERLTCRDCGKFMSCAGAYFSHVRMHERKKLPPKEREKKVVDDTVHQCEKCGATRTTYRGLKDHMLTHDEPKFCCEVCGVKKYTIHKLRSHMIVHSEERPFSCMQCTESFKTKETLHQHSLTHSSEPKFICDVCGHGVHRRSHLKLHMATHKNKSKLPASRSHTCEICQMDFVLLGNLQRHVKSVHGIDPPEVSDLAVAKCADCGKGYSSKMSLYHHWKKMHGPSAENYSKTKSYQCETCGKVLSSMRSYLNHSRGHSGERPYKCDICHETFKSVDAKMRHVRKHTNERPFLCHLCGKGFLCYPTLYQHKLIHTAERKHHCQYCDYKTHRPSALRVHLTKHSTAKPHCCEECGKCYKLPYDLKLHLAVHAGTAKRRVRVYKSKKAIENQNQSSNEKSDEAIFLEEACNSIVQR